MLVGNRTVFRLAAATILLMAQAAWAVPLESTPQDNERWRVEHDSAATGFLALLATELSGVPIVSQAAPFASIAADSATKLLPPVFETPPTARVFPNADGNADQCTFSYANQKVRSQYKNTLKLFESGVNDEDWGLFDAPRVSHFNSTVDVRLNGLESSGTLAEGRHGVGWEATTLYSSVWDTLVPTALVLTINKIKYARDAKRAIKAGANPTRSVARSLARSRALENFALDRAKNALEFVLPELAGQISTAQANDTEGLGLYSLLSTPAAINRDSSGVVVWDIHPPYFRSALTASNDPIERQDQIVLEATDFGGVRFSRVEKQLQNYFLPTDDCGRDLQLIAREFPSLFTIDDPNGDNEVLWRIQDAGPYHGSIASALAANQEIKQRVSGEPGVIAYDAFAFLRQRIVVQDTQAPLLVAPPGFSLLSSRAVDRTELNLGQALVLDRADPNPSLSIDGPERLEPGFRYIFNYTASDAFGNTTASAGATDVSHQQVVSVKQNNTAPVANQVTGQTVSAEPVELVLTAWDADELPLLGPAGETLGMRNDPLAFRIVERPENGEFVAPLLPYFLEDFRLQPEEIPGNVTAATLSCLTNDTVSPRAFEDKLAQLDRNQHLAYVDRCHCDNTALPAPPVELVYEPIYVDVTDDGDHYVRDREFRCNAGSVSKHQRISKWRDDRFLSAVPVTASGGNNPSDYFSVDDKQRVSVVRDETSLDPGSSALALHRYPVDLPPEPERRELIARIRANDAGPAGTDSAVDRPNKLTELIADIENGVIYMTDRRRIFMFDLATPGERKDFLGVVRDSDGNSDILFNDVVGGIDDMTCNGTGRLENGTTDPRNEGHTFALGPDGSLYLSQSCEHRIHKVAPPIRDASGNTQPGQYLGWMGSCTANKTRADGTPFNNCNVSTQTSKGFQCTNATCSRAPLTEFVYREPRSGSRPGQFNVPLHINTDRNGILYVADHNNFRVQRFQADGTFAGEAVSTGEGISTDNNFVLGNMGRPRHVAVDSTSFHVLEWTEGTADFFLHTFKTLPFYEVTDSSAKVSYVSRQNYQGSDRFSFLVDDGIACERACRGHGGGRSRLSAAIQPAL